MERHCAPSSIENAPKAAPVLDALAGAQRVWTTIEDGSAVRYLRRCGWSLEAEGRYDCGEVRRATDTTGAPASQTEISAYVCVRKKPVSRPLVERTVRSFNHVSCRCWHPRHALPVHGHGATGRCGHPYVIFPGFLAPKIANDIPIVGTSLAGSLAQCDREIPVCGAHRRRSVMIGFQQRITSQSRPA